MIEIRVWDDDEDDPDDDYDPDDWYGDDDEPDEPDWGYEEWRARYEDHCVQVHGGRECDCKPTLRERLTQGAGNFRRWMRNLRRHLHHEWDEPPF